MLSSQLTLGGVEGGDMRRFLRGILVLAGG